MIEASLRVVPEGEEEWVGPMDVASRYGAAAGRPLEVDLGCGKGRFLLAHAARHPGVNFLGIDRMLRRIRKVDNRARRMDLGNIRLLRCEAYYAVSYLLPPASVDVCYIFFPDPWPKARHEGHRLFNGTFLDALARVLKPGGAMHFATDHAPYFEQVAPLLAGDGRFEAVAPFVPDAEEQTDFELYYVTRESKAIGRFSVRRRA
ncbi:MAG: tRNA (guanosine(46)-N7)-methyltransferase TrmB [Kiritimatiellae bacterium]|nr:tRNA (guanosine(46)-N7)-methyltransferase TrmB [Kiritimatiellia bacterium]